MKRKVFLLGHDPGGINLLIPLIESLSSIRDIEVHLLIIGKFKDKVKIRSSSNIFFPQYLYIPMCRLPTRRRCESR